MHVHRLFMFSVRLLVNSTLLVVQYLRIKSYMWIFNCIGGEMVSTLFKDQLHIQAYVKTFVPNSSQYAENTNSFIEQIFLSSAPGPRGHVQRSWQQNQDVRAGWRKCQYNEGPQAQHSTVSQKAGNLRSHSVIIMFNLQVKEIWTCIF